MDERRAEPRVRQRRKVGIKLSSGKVLHLWSYDISAGGMQVLGDCSADVGDQFDIFFSVPDPETEDFVRIDARVRIIHVVYDSAQGCFRIGMEFLGFHGQGKEVFLRHVDLMLRAHFHRRGVFR